MAHACKHGCVRCGPPKHVASMAIHPRHVSTCVCHLMSLPPLTPWPWHHGTCPQTSSNCCRRPRGRISMSQGALESSRRVLSNAPLAGGPRHFSSPGRGGEGGRAWGTSTIPRGEQGACMPTTLHDTKHAQTCVGDVCATPLCEWEEWGERLGPCKGDVCTMVDSRWESKVHACNPPSTSS